MSDQSEAAHMNSMPNMKPITTSDLNLTDLVDKTMRDLFEKKHEGGAAAWEALTPLEREFASRPIVPLVWSVVNPLLEQVNAQIAAHTNEVNEKIAEHFKEAAIPTSVIPDTLEEIIW